MSQYEVYDEIRQRELQLEILPDEMIAISVAILGSLALLFLALTFFCLWTYGYIIYLYIMELKYPGILKNKSLGLGYFNPCGYYDIESDEESNIEIIQPPVATSCKKSKPKACKNDDLTVVVQGTDVTIENATKQAEKYIAEQTKGTTTKAAHVYVRPVFDRCKIKSEMDTVKDFKRQKKGRSTSTATNKPTKMQVKKWRDAYEMAQIEKEKRDRISNNIRGLAESVTSAHAHCLKAGDECKDEDGGSDSCSDDDGDVGGAVEYEVVVCFQDNDNNSNGGDDDGDEGSELDAIMEDEDNDFNSEEEEDREVYDLEMAQEEEEEHEDIYESE